MKEKLRNYRAVCAELEDVTAELDGLSTTDAVQSAATPPYSKHSVPVSGLPPTDRVKTLLARQAALRAEKLEIEGFVKSIEDYEIRRIISMRYINGKRQKSWQYIALKLHYRSEHTPVRKLKKFFQHGGNGGF